MYAAPTRPRYSVPGDERELPKPMKSGFVAVQFAAMPTTARGDTQDSDFSVHHSDGDSVSEGKSVISSLTNKGALGLGYCTHRLFGRGKIVQYIPPDKYRVNFTGFGLKVIMADYLTLEGD